MIISKITLSVFLLFGVLTASAQSITFGIKGGFNVSGLGHSNAYNADNKVINTVINFQAGAFADLGLGKISIQPAIIYTGKGGSTYMDYLDDDIRERVYGKASIYYLQVPVNIIYHVPLKNGQLYVGAGPFASRAVNGRFNVPNPPATQGGAPAYIQNRYHANLDFNNTNYNAFKSFDYGVNGLIGLRFNKVLFNINYDLGLADINPEKRNEYTTRTRSAGFSIGYVF